jgi:integrase
VDLVPSLAAALQQHMSWLKAEGRRRKTEFQWLFPNEEGKPHNHRSAGKAFRRVLRKGGLPRFRLYGLRHSYASLLLERGAPITYVSEQLGHTDSATTLRVYAHRIPKVAGGWRSSMECSGTRNGLVPHLEPKWNRFRKPWKIPRALTA